MISYKFSGAQPRINHDPPEALGKRRALRKSSLWFTMLTSQTRRAGYATVRQPIWLQGE